MHPADLKDPWNVDTAIKRDNWGRYVLPHPITGKETHFTRVTTGSGTLDDNYGLIDYKCRYVAYGMAQQPHLVTLAKSAKDGEDRAVLNDVIKQAEIAGGGGRKANIGTALHSYTEQIDRGKRPRVEDAYRDHVTRYKTAVAQHHLTFVPELIEAVVCYPDLGLCGTMDRGAIWPHSKLPVAYDLKTGKLDYIKVKTAQQLAAYANCSHRWDPEKQQWFEMPAMNLDWGLVMHLPAEGDAEPVLYKVNLTEGLRLLLMSMEVRSLRSKKGKHLFTAITADAVPTETANREEALRDRVRRIVQFAPAKQALLGLWPREMPTLSEGGLNDTQLDLIEGWCDQVESEHGLN